MKKIGIVGGVAWQSTVEYYAHICRRCGANNFPEMSIESLDHNRAVSCLGIDGDEASWSQFDDYHRAALKRLEASGADFAVIASNSPHHRFEPIIRGVGIPVISIFDVVAGESARIGATEVLILGTAVIMRSPVFRREFAKYGIEASGPDSETTRSATVDLIHDLQLENQEGAAERLHAIAKPAFHRQFRARPVVCLACTELPSAFPKMKSMPSFELDGTLYLNSTILHANAAFDFALQPELNSSRIVRESG